MTDVEEIRELVAELAEALDPHLTEAEHERFAGKCLVVGADLDRLAAAVRAGGNAADALAEIERIAIGGSDPADIQERLTDVWRVAREALGTLEPADEAET